MKLRISVFIVLSVLPVAAQGTNCDLGGYKPQEGLKAEVRGGALELQWQGNVKKSYARPLLCAPVSQSFRNWRRKNRGGKWIVLGQNLTPEFEFTSGVRRLSEQQMAPLREMKVELTPEVDREGKVECFLGFASDGSGPARERIWIFPESRKKSASAWAKYQATGCQVKTRARESKSLSRIRCGHFHRLAPIHGLPRNQSAPAGG